MHSQASSSRTGRRRGVEGIVQPLTVSFHATGAGNTLLLLYSGAFDTTQPCVDNLGHEWPVVISHQFDSPFDSGVYQPSQNVPGITSVSCPQFGFLDTLMFVEIAGIDSGRAMQLDRVGDVYAGIDINPLQCGTRNSGTISTLPGGVTLFFFFSDEIDNLTFPDLSLFTPAHDNITSASDVHAVLSLTISDLPFEVTTEDLFSEVSDGTATAPFFTFQNPIKFQDPNEDLPSVVGQIGCFAINVNGISAVDPVPDLMNGPKVIGVSDLPPQGIGADLLATLGRPVSGIAADGVSQIVVKIPTAAAGDQCTLTILNEQRAVRVLGKAGEFLCRASQLQVQHESGKVWNSD